MCLKNFDVYGIHLETINSVCYTCIYIPVDVYIMRLWHNSHKLTGHQMCIVVLKMDPDIRQHELEPLRHHLFLQERNLNKEQDVLQRIGVLVLGQLKIQGFPHLFTPPLIDQVLLGVSHMTWGALHHTGFDGVVMGPRVLGA